MKRYLQFFFLFLSLFIFIIGCSNSPEKEDPIVYCGGNYGDGAYTYPCYWKGTTRVTLPSEGPRYFVNSIYVSGSTVYNGGFYREDAIYNIPPFNNHHITIDYGCYWKDNTLVRLPIPGAYDSRIYSIFAVGDTVYSGGYYDMTFNYDDVGGPDIPCYWQGATKTGLENGEIHDAIVKSIFVSDGVVYSGGYYVDGDQYIPCYWQGTTLVLLSGDGLHNAFVTSIFVSGGTVYCGGFYSDGATNNIPCYWEGTTLKPLSGTGLQRGWVNSLYVSENTVYCGGTYFNGSKNIACYWKNSTPVILPDNGTLYPVVTSISVANSTVYCGGYLCNDEPSAAPSTPCYWKGNNLITLAGGIHGLVNSIFVQ